MMNGLPPDLYGQKSPLDINELKLNGTASNNTRSYGPFFTKFDGEYKSLMIFKEV